MSQTWTDDIYESSYDAQTYLAKMEENFASLRSMFSGASAPSSPDPFQLWGDTTKKVLKYRNAGDTDWLGMFHGGGGQRIWIASNSVLDGWALLGGVSDKVLALKGGATYTTGGATAGSWSAPAGTNHNHQWYNSRQPSQNDKVRNWLGIQIDVPKLDGSTGRLLWVLSSESTSAEYSLGDSYTKKTTMTAGNYRPAAYVGTLQYLDI